MQEFDLKELSLLKCPLSEASLEVVSRLDSSMKLRWSGEASASNLQRHLRRIGGVAKRFDLVDIDIARKGSRLPPMPFGMATSEIPPPFQPIDNYRFQNMQLGARNDGVRIQTDGPCNLSNVSIEFEDLLALLRLGNFEFGNLEVMDGDRKMTMSGPSFFFFDFAWDRITVDELFRYLTVATDQKHLSLFDPQFDSVDDWVRLEKTNLEFLNIGWSDVPEDWEQCLEQLNTRRLRVVVHVPLDTKYEAGKARIEAKSDGRISFRRVTRRAPGSPRVGILE